MRVVARKNSDPSRSTHPKIYKKHQEAVFSFQAKSKPHQIDTLNPCELFSRLFIKLQVDYNIYCLPVVPHKAVAEVSKIGNL